MKKVLSEKRDVVVPAKIKIFTSIRQMLDFEYYLSNELCKIRGINTNMKKELIACLVNDITEMFFSLTDEAIEQIKNGKNCHEY